MSFYLYIDPGTGSLLLQVVVGGIVAFGLFFKNKIRLFLSLFKKGSSDDLTENDN